MKRLVPTLFLVFSFATAVSAQSAQPTATPDNRDVVKIETNVIQLDVTVTDKKGNPITDLRRDEIEIYENGKRQDLIGLSFVSGSNRSQLPATEPKTTAPPIPVPGSQRPEKIRRTLALVIDDLSLSFESAFWVQTSVKKFVLEQMQDGDLVAIIRTGSGIGALQQFTTDKNQLLAAANKIRFNPGSSGAIGVFNPITPDLIERSGSSSGRPGADEEFERDVNEFRETIFARGTLGALNYIIRGMRDLPGRKSVLLVSDGFPIVTRDERGVPRGFGVIDRLRRLTDLANRASVVVYTIDARGLVVPGLTAADDTFGLSSERIEQRLADRSNRFFDTQEGLRYLARETGGIAILNQNDVSKGIRRVLDDQSYYLVAYEPDGATFDPRTRKYNRIQVKVLRPGVNVRYRSGFFGVVDSAIKTPTVNATQAIMNALTSPFAVNDISVSMNAVFTAPERDKMFLRSYIHLDASDLTFIKQPDGTYKTTIDLVAMMFGDNGIVVDEHSRKYSVGIKEEGYQRILKKGFVYEFALPLKKPGGIQLRVAVRDAETNKVGSANQFLDVPNLKKNRLTLSGIIFESMPLESWQMILNDRTVYDEVRKTTDPLFDTSLRRFRSGTALRYGVDIYNAKTTETGKPELTKMVKIYRDGKEFYTSPEMPVDVKAGSIASGITTTGTVRIGANMPAGEYVLQVVVFDKLAKEKRGIAHQFVSFEVTENTE